MIMADKSVMANYRGFVAYMEWYDIRNLKLKRLN
jgi:hypothetical protein